LESLCKQHEEAIAKLKEENTSLEQGIQSLNDLFLEIAAEMGLDRMGEADSDDEDDGGDAAALAASATLVVTAPEVVAEEEEDLEMLIPE
jgi:hypothetical protein